MSALVVSRAHIDARSSPARRAAAAVHAAASPRINPAPRDREPGSRVKMSKVIVPVSP